MAEKCRECGKELTEGIAFCTECGAKVPEAMEKQTDAFSKEAIPVSEEVPVIFEKMPAQKNTLKEEPVRASREVVSATQTVSQYDPEATQTGVVSTGTYFGLIVLFAIPVIGFLACVILSFAPKNKSLRHFARAVLLWMIIGLILLAGAATAIYFSLDAISEYIKEWVDGTFGEVFDSLKDIPRYIEQMEDGLDKINGIDFDSLPKK